jgi:hypothetical protein
MAIKFYPSDPKYNPNLSLNTGYLQTKILRVAHKTQAIFQTWNFYFNFFK